MSALAPYATVKGGGVGWALSRFRGEGQTPPPPVTVECGPVIIEASPASPMNHHYHTSVDRISDLVREGGLGSERRYDLLGSIPGDPCAANDSASKSVVRSQTPSLLPHMKGNHTVPPSRFVILSLLFSLRVDGCRPLKMGNLAQGQGPLQDDSLSEGNDWRRSFVEFFRYEKHRRLVVR